MTLNIWNYTRPWPLRRERIANLILAHSPDVVALQETRHDWRFERGLGQGDQLAELTGYHAAWLTGQVYVPLLRVDEGLTTLTREKPLGVIEAKLQRDPRDHRDENQRVCLGVVVQYAGKEVHAYNTHFSLSSAGRISNAREVSRLVALESPDVPAVLMGDLNAEPAEPAIHALLNSEDAAFFDCWTRANGDAPGYTYRSGRAVKRIDYVLGRQFATVQQAVIVGDDANDGIYPSDHLGILVDLETR